MAEDISPLEALRQLLDDVDSPGDRDNLSMAPRASGRLPSRSRGLVGSFHLVRGAGTYACGFEDSKAVHPGLHVQGFGFVPLPLPEEQGKLLQQVCSPAPFGRGDQTLWDTTVRSTWQVDASKLQCLNPGTASTVLLTVHTTRLPASAEALPPVLCHQPVDC